MKQINIEHVKNSVAESIEKTLKVKLSPEERQRAQLLSEAKYFADEVFKQCRQQNFTLYQFETIIESLRSRYSLEVSKATDIARLSETKD